MARCIDEVEDILLAVLGLVYSADGLGLDGDSALPLQIHIVQHLGLHLPAGQKTGLLDDAVRQGGFSVVDVSNDTEIADFTLVKCCHSKIPPLSGLVLSNS